MKKLILFTITVLSLFSCNSKKSTTMSESAFVKQKDGHFVIGDNPYYFIGTNY